jgi:hypothetical protein
VDGALRINPAAAGSLQEAHQGWTADPGPLGRLFIDPKAKVREAIRQRPGMADVSDAEIEAMMEAYGQRAAPPPAAGGP